MKRLLALALTFALTSLFAIDPTIPVLDMDQFRNPDTRDQFVADLSVACQEVGFFALVNPGVDLEVLDNAYKAIADFFHLDKQTKMKYCYPSMDGQRGYFPGESAKGEERWDVKEFYHVGHEFTLEQVQRLGVTYPNVWPEEVDFKEPVSTLFSELQKHMAPLEQALAIAIDQQPDFFSNMTEEGEILLRALRYPANPPKEAIWAGEHTDICLFTIIPRTTAPGLQVLNREGDWITVVAPDDTFIVNVGDKLENITNGLFRSGLHRVVDLGHNTERFSIPFFVHPRMLDDMSPLPECIEMTGGEQLYPKATSLELLEERLVELGLASPEMLEHLSQSGFVERTIKLGRASPEVLHALVDADLASEAVIAAALET